MLMAEKITLLVHSNFPRPLLPVVSPAGSWPGPHPCAVRERNESLWVSYKFPQAEIVLDLLRGAQICWCWELCACVGTRQPKVSHPHTLSPS